MGQESSSDRDSGSCRYVLKTLRTDLPEDEHIKGIVDLAIEADFLSILKHANIISMRAMANSDPHESKFFVILDKLDMTLDRKFNFWRKLVGENTGYWVPCYGYCCAKSHALHANWKERLTVALEISKAIQYLHGSGIIYRDLKPDNIGFTEAGNLKIFDFGLAKRLEFTEKTAGGFYNLTGNTGSLRYMAPEVANDEPYDLSAGTHANTSWPMNTHLRGTLLSALTLDLHCTTIPLASCRYVFVWHYLLANLLACYTVFWLQSEATRRQGRSTRAAT
jgi:serine/threonine protein kinase